MNSGLTTLKGGKQALFLGSGDLKKISKLFSDYYTSQANVNTWGGELSDGIRINSTIDNYWVTANENSIVIIQDNLRKNDILDGFNQIYSKYHNDITFKLDKDIDFLNFNDDEKVIDF